MKKHINLLYGKTDHERVERLVFYFEVLTYLFGIVIAVVVGFIIFAKLQRKRQYDSLLLAKANFIKDSLSRSDIETKAIFINDKASAVQGFRAEDINFLPYYRVLKRYMPIASDSAAIELISFDNQKNAKFVVNFTNYDIFLDFLKSIETENFLSIFDNLKLDSFTASEFEGVVYQLSFSGKFKPVNEN